MCVYMGVGVWVGVYVYACACVCVYACITNFVHCSRWMSQLKLWLYIEVYKNYKLYPLQSYLNYLRYLDIYNHKK